MRDWIIGFVSAYGYLGISGLIFIENVFPPIPSELILTFGGFATTYTSMQPWLVVLFATIGSVLGAVVLYAIGRFLSPERLGGLLDGKVGKVLHFRRKDLEKADAWFRKKQVWAVLICRCVPVVRSLISIPAGMAKMAILPFLGLTALGSAVWNTVLVWAGAALGAAWESALVYTDLYTKIAVVVIGLVCVALVAWWYFKKRKKKTAGNGAANTPQDPSDP